MEHVSTNIKKLIQELATDPDFPCAPLDWTRDEAKRIASSLSDLKEIGCKSSWPVHI